MKPSLIALVALALPSFAWAQAPAPETPPPTETSAPSATPAPPAPAAPAATAVAILDRANAAYEYGDMKEVVASARAIVDGEAEATPPERVQALRLLGIGLYLTGRPAGAEAAFLELLRNRPKARLDATTTRPEVVAFFEGVRRRHRNEIEAAARERSRRSMIWNFLPPIGQFKNGDYGRGGLLLGLEVTSAAAAITTNALLHSWCPAGAHFVCPGKNDAAHTARTVNIVSVGVLATSYVVGVIDAFVRADHEPETEERSVSLFLFPGGGGVSGRF
jgi:hypothetical protein